MIWYSILANGTQHDEPMSVVKDDDDDDDDGEKKMEIT